MRSAAFSLGGSHHERVEVRVRGYERQPTGNYDDDNWLYAEILVSVGAFRGGFPTSILTYEIAEFRKQLDILYITLGGQAELETMEGQIYLRLTGNGRGGVSVEGEARDSGLGNRLEFTLALDQTNLAVAIDEIDAVLAQFPVRTGSLAV